MVFGGAPLDFFKKIPSKMGIHLLEGNDKSGAWISDHPKSNQHEDQFGATTRSISTLQ